MNPKLQKLLYEWPLNIAQYEAMVIGGLTATEAIASVVAFMVPMAVVGNKIAAILLGAVLAALTALSLRRVEKLGNVSFPIYLAKRWRAGREKRSIHLVQIMGVEGATIEFEDEARQPILSIE